VVCVCRAATTCSVVGGESARIADSQQRSSSNEVETRSSSERKEFAHSACSCASRLRDARRGHEGNAHDDCDELEMGSGAEL